MPSRSPTTLAVLALLALAPVASANSQGAVSSFTLDNGMIGVVIEDHRAPVVTSMVWYRVGGADDPTGQSGLAHYLEHMMFKATDKLKDGEFSAVVAANGGQENAFTTSDYTAFFQRISADRLDLVLGMEADRMVNLAPDPASALSERDVIIEERRQRIENSPDGPFQEGRDATLYFNSPYGRPVIGWKHEMQRLTLDEVMAFYRAHYAPNNAILVVAGDVTPDEVHRLAQLHFGSIPASPAITPRDRAQEPPPLAARHLEFRDPRVREAVLSRSYLAPPRRPGDQEQAAALYLLSEVLGGSNITSVMAQQLQFGGGIAIGSGAYYTDVSFDPRSFTLYVLPKPGVSQADVEARLDALIAKFIAEGPDPAELARIKTRIRASDIYALDDQERRARRIGAALASGLTLADVAAWPNLLQAVTPGQVQAAARAVFRPEASVTAWELPADPGAAVSGPRDTGFAHAPDADFGGVMR